LGSTMEISTYFSVHEKLLCIYKRISNGYHRLNLVCFHIDVYVPHLIRGEFKISDEGFIPECRISFEVGVGAQSESCFYKKPFFEMRCI
jgi:hypothetical protein